MKNVAATEIKNRLGQYLRAVEVEPITIEVSHRPTAVMISHAEYTRLMRLDDEYWTARARQAEKSGYLGADAAMETLVNGISRNED